MGPVGGGLLVSKWGLGGAVVHSSTWTVGLSHTEPFLLPEWPFFPLSTDFYSNANPAMCSLCYALLWLIMEASCLDCGQSWPSVFHLGSQLDRDQLKILEKAVAAQSVSL